MASSCRLWAAVLLQLGLSISCMFRPAPGSVGTVPSCLSSAPPSEQRWSFPIHTRESSERVSNLPGLGAVRSRGRLNPGGPVSEPVCEECLSGGTGLTGGRPGCRRPLLALAQEVRACFRPWVQSPVHSLGPGFARGPSQLLPFPSNPRDLSGAWGLSGRGLWWVPPLGKF